MTSRHLHEREAARFAGDRLAHAILTSLRGDSVDLKQRLLNYSITGGPAWALPDGDHMVTRYDPETAGMMVIQCHTEKDDAMRAVTELTEMAARVGLPQQHYRYAKRNSRHPWQP